MQDVLTFPLVQIKDLPDHTRDWLLGRSSATGKSPAEVLREVLISAATAEGFPPEPPPATSAPHGPHGKGRAA